MGRNFKKQKGISSHTKQGLQKNGAVIEQNQSVNALFFNKQQNNNISKIKSVARKRQLFGRKSGNNNNTPPYNNGKRNTNKPKQAQLETALFHDKLEMVHILHSISSTKNNWEEISQSDHPFSHSQNEEKAQKALQSFNPSRLNKWLGRKGKEEKHLLDLVEKAKIADQQLAKTWQKKKALAVQILAGELLAYEKVLQDELIIGDLIQLGIDINYRIISSTVLAFDVSLISQEDVPTFAKAAISSKKSIMKKMYYTAHQDYLCSIALRLGQEGFNLLPVENIYVHMKDATEHSDKLENVLSVKFTKDLFATIHFDECDCSDEIEKFPNRMHFQKMSGLQPIAKLMEE